MNKGVKEGLIKICMAEAKSKILDVVADFKPSKSLCYQSYRDPSDLDQFMDFCFQIVTLRAEIKILKP